MKIWKQALTPGLVTALCKAIEFVHANDRNFFHLQKDLTALTKSEYNNFQKLRFHGLIAHVEDHIGYWLITKRGGQFLRGELNIPDFVLTFRNRVVSHSDKLVSIRGFRNAPPTFDDRKDFLDNAFEIV
jgi:hypothetical protein